MSAGDVATLALSWADGRATALGKVTITAEGVELDEVLDALVAGLKATTDRAYVIEASEIAEVTRRQPIAPRGGVRPTVPARPVVLPKPRTGAGSP